ncbi:MAG: GTP-binding protein [Acetobacteraceae bacterium]|nr:GTP-binding protein [Acetobacteraceae bacterium]
MIPVSIVTGFLGAGKTTLIGRILRDPGFARTAVIVNEFGEIGLDHDLIASGDETFLALTTGCLCCAVRSDLIETLLDLGQRAAGQFDRVLIETSGLADPTPILHALMTDPAVCAAHAIDTMVTVIDPVLGLATLDRFPEARRQAALADRLVFSKTDLAAPDSVLLARLDRLNPGAPRIDVRDITPDAVFAGADPIARAMRMTEIPDRPKVSPFSRARHSDGISTNWLRRARPLPALALTLWLQALTEHCGDRLIRMKGLVAIAEMPGRPAVVHGVQHVFSPPEFLDRWPSADHETRLVFIFRDMPRHFPARLLAAIEDETRDELDRVSAAVLARANREMEGP